MEVVLVLVVLAIAAILVLEPLRRRSGAAVPASTDRAELEAARDAKLREIRDTELDYRTGKLSHDDWRELDSELRAEAIRLLRRLDALDPTESDRNPRH